MKMTVVVDVDERKGTAEQIAHAIATEFDGSDIDDGTASFEIEVESVTLTGE